MIDPRESVIESRLSGIKRIVAVTGGKGGVGKSLVSAGLALSFTKSGVKTGLLDLDFSSPSQHVILGLEGGMPEEERGLIPPLFHGIRFMSLCLFSGDNPMPLRGQDISNAIIELLAVTLWGDLDLLVVDMPPGLSDATLDVIRLIPRAEAILVSTPSKVSFETVGKMIRLLRGLGAPMLGVLENMGNGGGFVREASEKAGVPFIGEIPFDPGLENRIGNTDRLLESEAVRRIDIMLNTADNLIAHGGPQ